MMNRREFLMASGAAALLGGCHFRGVGDAAAFDENLSVFVSDVHIHPNSYHIERFERVVNQILSLRPLPRRVVCFGDIAFLYGHKEDYVASKPLFDRLKAAGIELTFGMGNHDRRDHFHELWPEYAARELLKGYVVSETSLGTCDLVMLDTLWQYYPDGVDKWQTPGQLGGEQLEWLFETMPKRKRPFFLAAHHHVSEIVEGCKWQHVVDLMMDTPCCLGWIHGHDHVWKNTLLRRSNAKWGDNTFKRTLCLPSTGHWGDIGFVTFRTSPNCAHAELNIMDHYFPNPSKRTWIDDEIIREKRGGVWSVRW